MFILDTTINSAQVFTLGNLFGPPGLNPAAIVPAVHGAAQQQRASSLNRLFQIVTSGQANTQEYETLLRQLRRTQAIGLPQDTINLLNQNIVFQQTQLEGALEDLGQLVDPQEIINANAQVIAISIRISLINEFLPPQPQK